MAIFPALYGSFLSDTDDNARISGVPAIENEREYVAMKSLLAEVEQALEQIETAELRRDLLDMRAMYRAAIAGYEVVRRSRRD